MVHKIFIDSNEKKREENRYYICSIIVITLEKYQ